MHFVDFTSTTKAGPLAQSVEQRTFNPLVESSNLSRPTSLIFENLGC